MKIILKPIQFPNLKDEIIISIEGSNKVSDIVNEIVKVKPEAGKFLDFMFRGKKLNYEKTIQEQGVKEGTKLMMYQSDSDKQPTQSKEKEANINKDKAKEELIKMGFNVDMVESVVKTIPNVDNLSSEVIIEKSIKFLKSFQKETVEEYAIEIEESNSYLKIEEDKITAVFTMGDGIQGQLGVGKYIKSDFPMRVNKLRTLKIKSIACGVSHTTALTINGYGKIKI